MRAKSAAIIGGSLRRRVASAPRACAERYREVASPGPADAALLEQAYRAIIAGGDTGIGIVRLEGRFGDRKAAEAAVDRLRAVGRVETVDAARGLRYRTTVAPPSCRPA